MNVKFKEGSETANNVGNDWIVSAKQVAILVEDKIFVIWGGEEKFQVLLDIILML